MKNLNFVILVGLVLVLGGCATSRPMFSGFGCAGTEVLATRQVLATQPAPVGMSESEALGWAREARALENDRARNALAFREQDRRADEDRRRDRRERERMEIRAKEAEAQRISDGLSAVGRGLQEVVRERARARTEPRSVEHYRSTKSDHGGSAKKH